MALFTTTRGLDRLVNFSDATVAIAVTVLALPLTELVGTGNDGTASQLLSGHASAILAFLISFLVIAALWTEHHRLFESLVEYSSALMRLNFVWLFAVVVLPVSTAVNQHVSAGDRFPAALYLGNLFVAFLALAAMHRVALRDERLIHPDRRGTFSAGRNTVTTVICAVALVIALTVPAVGQWAVFLIILTDPVWLLIQRRRGPERS